MSSQVGSGRLIVAADDDDDILTLVVFRLEHDGYTVLAAHDGDEALQLTRAHLPALAILDVMMPGLSGYEVVRALRADESTQGVKVILLTAKAQEQDIATGFAVGADDYLKKPFSPAELSRRVTDMLTP